MSEPTKEIRYFVMHRGQWHGPVPLRRLHELAEEGRLAPQTVCQLEGGRRRVRLSDVLGGRGEADTSAPVEGSDASAPPPRQWTPSRRMGPAEGTPGSTPGAGSTEPARYVDRSAEERRRHPGVFQPVGVRTEEASPRRRPAQHPTDVVEEDADEQPDPIPPAPVLRGRVLEELNPWLVSYPFHWLCVVLTALVALIGWTWVFQDAGEGGVDWKLPGVLTLASLGNIGLLLWRWKSLCYRIREDGVEARSGFLREERDALRWSDVGKIRIRRVFPWGWFGLPTVIVEPAEEVEYFPVWIERVRHARAFARRIADQRDQSTGEQPARENTP